MEKREVPIDNKLEDEISYQAYVCPSACYIISKAIDQSRLQASFYP
jgi:hypothetical protein